ncbi:uncharacterized protein [Dermacentor albipictus]|uniref:uncharacterized protein isoform X2 n=1 Tax=Dermacentor albipictus TaxID=60249 RepID=UPI0038FC3F8B
MAYYPEQAYPEASAYPEYSAFQEFSEVDDQYGAPQLSEYPTSKPEEEGTGMRYVLGVCGVIILFALATVAVVFLLAYQGSEVDDAGGSNRSGGGDAPPPMEVPAVEQITTTLLQTAPLPGTTRARTSPSPSTPRPTTSRSTASKASKALTASTTPSTKPGPMTVTTPPPPLLCSVGATPTALRPLLPPDRTCDILVYAHVRFFNHTLRPVISEMSFHTFRNVCEFYAHTTCGVSFDARHIPPPTFASIEFEETLEELKRKFHIDHYGILNIYGSEDFVDSVSKKDAPRVLTALRRLLGEDDRERHKVFVGVGYRYYNATNAWKSLTYAASNLASKDLDILVIITSFLTLGDRHECITLPVNAMKSPNRFVPTLDAASVMAKAEFARPSIVVAFTFQMGVPYYVLTKEYNPIIEAMYEPCTLFGISDYSQACQADSTDLSLEKTVIGLNKAESMKLLGKKIFQSHDTLHYMTEKAKIIMERPDTRVNLSWFLWDVHLTDTTRTCLTGGPFERVKGFRDFFYRQAQMPKG